MSDLVERLRNFRTRGAKYGDVFASYSPRVCKEAAEEIERLRAALEKIANDGGRSCEPDAWCLEEMARKALQQKPEDQK